MTTTDAGPVEALKAAFVHRDFSRVADRLADDVVLRSPVLETSWSTKAVLDRLGPAMVSIFDDVAFTDIVGLPEIGELERRFGTC